MSPNQNGFLIMSGVPCNAGYTVGTQFMPQQVLFHSCNTTDSHPILGFLMMTPLEHQMAL